MAGLRAVGRIRPSRRSSTGLRMLSPAGDRLGLERIGAVARPARPAAGPAAAGVPRRRDQRQGLDLRLPSRRARSGGPTASTSFTSPHLVRFNERIRIAGQADRGRARSRPCWPRSSTRATASSRASSRSTTAVAFLAFARTPADACMLEVGLGGRLDATNVDRTPARLRDRQRRHRPSAVPRREPRRDRRRESRDRQARRAAGRPCPAARSRSGDQRDRRRERGAPLLLEGRDWDDRPHVCGPRFPARTRCATPTSPGRCSGAQDRLAGWPRIIRQRARRPRAGRRGSSSSPTVR